MIDTFVAVVASIASWEGSVKAGLTAIISAVFGGLGGAFTSRSKAREDAIEKRVEELCAEIKQCSLDAASYWKTVPADPELSLRASMVEAGIARINGYIAILSKFVSAPASREMVAASSIFLRETTGGDFGVKGRPEDFDQAAIAIRASADFVVDVRKARLLDQRGWIMRRWRHRSASPNITATDVAFLCVAVLGLLTILAFFLLIATS